MQSNGGYKIMFFLLKTATKTLFAGFSWTSAFLSLMSSS